jgi:hypothetical protein
MLPQIGRVGKTSAFGGSLSHEHEGGIEGEHIELVVRD